MTHALLVLFGVPTLALSPNAALLAAWTVGQGPGSGGADWTAEGEQDTELFGECVSSLGDVNGDGYADVIIGAPQYSSDHSAEGRALVYLGSPAGLGHTPVWRLRGGQANAHLGFSVAGAGDVNGDGFDDAIVGEAGYDVAYYNDGRARLFSGSAQGLAQQASWVVAGSSYESRYGGDVAAAGDVNGDGYDDVLITGGGHALAYLGSLGGLAQDPAWMVPAGSFYACVAAAGDVNADGYADVIVGDPPRARVYFGSAQGLGTDAVWTGECDQSANFGFAVACAGDVNGDGYADVVVGAKEYVGGAGLAGAAFVYHGSASGLSTLADWSKEGDSYLGTLGWSVASAGDVNDDGYSDVLLGDPDNSNANGSHAGRVYLYLGSAAGLEGLAAWTSEGEADSALHGESVASAGDVNGTGLPDLIVGASGTFIDDLPFVGRVHLYQDILCTSIGSSTCIATQNSTGQPAAISAWCSASTTAGQLKLKATPVPDTFGLFFHGQNAAQEPFGNGFLCANGELLRGHVVHGTGKVASYVYDGSDSEHTLTAFAGTTRHFQYWFRDPAAGGALFNTSNAISIELLP